jgi:hypothetical protein
MGNGVDEGSVGSLVVIDVNYGKDMQENASKAQEG